MKSYFLLFMVALYFNVKSQNYIYNYDFETADGGNSWPTGVAQADKMTSWETRTKSVGSLDLHSPDWINSNGTGVQTIMGVHPSAHTGSGMIGMTNYELIQQNFNSGSSLEAETYHNISMWVYMPANSSKNCRLKIMFSNSRLKYKNENILTGSQQSSDLCTNDYIDYHNSLSSWTTIHEFDFNNLNLTYDSWQKISFTFKTPPNSILNNYDFFAMELRKNGYNPSSIAGNCEDSYIFIDDISLVKSTFCDAACAPNLGSITHGTFANAMFSNYAWGFTVNNAIGIEFTLYDRWGIAAISTETAFDPNGLIDAGYSDYAFGWNALNNNNQVFPEDTYPYILKIYNCNETINHVGSIYIIGNGYPSSLGYNIHNFELNDCCPNDRYIQNVTYLNDYIETAKNNIFAGNNVTTSVANGNVIIGYGVDVKYVAKNINIQSGFSVMPGGTFKAIATEDCIYQSVQRKSLRERPSLDGNNSFKINNTVNSDLLIYPNPSNGIFTFKTLNSEITNIEIYNYFGTKIVSYNKENFNSLINLEDHANGTYFYKVILSDGKVNSGKLIKTN